MKRYLILLLILNLAFCSCTPVRDDGVWPTGTTEPPVTTEPPAEPELEYTVLDALPERDMEGATVVITAEDVSPFLSDGKYMYDAAISARNAAVGEKFNATVAVTKTDAAKMFDDLSAAKLSGSYYSDILAIPLSSVGGFARAGLIKDLSAADGISKDADYYVKTDAFTDRGATYAYMCESVASGYGYCVFYNRRLAEEKGIDFLSMVKDGTWTWDAFIKYTEGMHGAGFTYGDGEQFVNAVVSSSGLEYTAFTDGVRTADYVGEFADGVMETASKIYACPGYAPSDDPASLFLKGACFMYVAPMNEAEKFALMPDSYGILPLPTYGGGTDYKTYMSPDTPVLCIPDGECASEDAPYVLEAIAAASEAEMESKYLLHLANFYMHGEDDVQMAAFIEDSAVYEYVYAFGPANDHVANCTYWATQQAIMAGEDHNYLYKGWLDEFNAFVN